MGVTTDGHRGGLVAPGLHTDGEPESGSYRWVTLVVGVSFPSMSTKFRTATGDAGYYLYRDPAGRGGTFHRPAGLSPL